MSAGLRGVGEPAARNKESPRERAFDAIVAVFICAVVLFSSISVLLLGSVHQYRDSRSSTERDLIGLIAESMRAAPGHLARIGDMDSAGFDRLIHCQAASEILNQTVHAARTLRSMYDEESTTYHVIDFHLRGAAQMTETVVGMYQTHLRIYYKIDVSYPFDLTINDLLRNVTGNMLDLASLFIEQPEGYTLPWEIYYKSVGELDMSAIEDLSESIIDDGYHMQRLIDV